MLSRQLKSLNCLSNRLVRCFVIPLLGLIVLIVVVDQAAVDSGAQEKAQKNSESDQETKDEPSDTSAKQIPHSDLIRDHGSVVIQIGSFDKVVSDIKRLMTDVGYGGFAGFADSLFPAKEVGINRDAGLTVYSEEAPFYQGGVVQFQIADRQELLDSLDVDKDDVTGGAWKYYGEGVERELGMWLWPWTDLNSIQINDDSFLVGDGGTDFSDGLLDAELLKPRIGKNLADIIERSGISILGLDANELGLDDFEAKDLVDFLEMGLSESEKDWLEDFAEVVRATDLGVVGLQYHEGKVLELRSFVQVRKGANFANLVDLNAATQPWKADLGLEAQNLIASAAFKMDTFKSPVAPRLIPQAVAYQLAPKMLQDSRGSMLQTLLTLCGDSWNELSAARIALYHRDKILTLGELTVIGVLDAKDPAQVLIELQRIASLTSPMQNEERKFQRSEEIRRLIEQLQSEEKAVSDRAYSRLRLVGEAAREALDELRSSTQDVALEKRIGYLIVAMDRQKNRRHGISDPMFWATLSPGLELKQNVSTLDGFPVHHIEITADPSKTEKEVASSIEMMTGIFGTDWNKVSVVQVTDHFVFMLGSDQAKLRRIVKQTAEGKGVLAKQLEGVGHSSKVAQLQAWFHPGKIAELTGQYRPNWQNDTMKKLMESDARLCWLGLNIQRNGLGADLLVPAPQIGPFLFGGF